MAEDEATDTARVAVSPRRSLWLRWLILPLLLILGLAFLAFWIQRKDIADNVIASQLESKGVPPMRSTS